MEDDNLSITNGSMNYISINEHRQFMNELDNELISICNQDSILRKTTDLLTSCPNNNQFDQQVSEFFNSKVENCLGRAMKLKLVFLDGKSCDVFVAQNINLAQFKLIIQRCIGLRLQTNAKQERKRDVIRSINWKYIWRKYDLWLDRTTRICLCNYQSNTSNFKDILAAITNHSTLEFIHRT